MTPTRREFIKSVGIAIAGLLLSRYAPLLPTDDSPRGRLRACWLRFGWLAEETRKTWNGNDDNYSGPLSLLAQAHDAALDELVATGELTRAVADEIAAGFGAATRHVWRSNVPITCYEPMMIDYGPTSAGQLVQQAAALDGLARSGNLDPATVAQVQHAIERDIAFAALSGDEVEALYAELRARVGNNYPAMPSFDQVELEVTPEAAAAARYLVELLLGTLP